jgi:16S rRNA A1518/A1519 N6-dimethyltransferase RsmA/KsgA/DIM1 with predicted DNA glycosylase/AP lyase activity
MGRIVVELDGDLEKAFRDEVARRLGMKKGNIKIALEDAIKFWIDRKV